MPFVTEEVSEYKCLDCPSFNQSHGDISYFKMIAGKIVASIKKDTLNLLNDTVNKRLNDVSLVSEPLQEDEIRM